MLSLSIIGAMQRTCPKLTALWLEWTGIPDLDKCSFEVKRGERGSGPWTHIKIPARVSNPYATWEAFYNVVNADKHDRRETTPIVIPYKTDYAQRFWTYCENRHGQITGPLEWWWALACLRHQGSISASRQLLSALGVSPDKVKAGLVSFVNPTILNGDLTGDYYHGPTHMRVHYPADRKTRANINIKVSKVIESAVIKTALG